MITGSNLFKPEMEGSAKLNFNIYNRKQNNSLRCEISITVNRNKIHIQAKVDSG